MSLTINQQEQVALFKHKKIEGKTNEQANLEIKRDIDFEKALKKKNNITNSLERQLLNKDEYINQLRIKIKELKDRLFKTKFRFLGSNQRDTGDYYATTKELWRILSCFEGNNKIKLDDLTKISTLNRRKIRDNAISFLIKTKLIKQSGRNPTYFEKLSTENISQTQK